MEDKLLSRYPMWQRLATWWNERAQRRAETQLANQFELYFYDEQLTDDTVVFVHGLGGHFRDTWERFPELLRHDLDLPRFDILLWGYNGSPLPGAAGVAAESQRLMGDLRMRLRAARSIFLIGHSMGGLTVLKGLCDEHVNRRARDLPAKAVRHVFLYATPVLGAAAATVITHTIKRLPALGSIASRYFDELASGVFVNELIAAVHDCVYHPRVRRGEERSKRHIPISACVANQDSVVHPSSAKAIFGSPPPVYFDAGHLDCKTPDSDTDRRYLPVKNVLMDHYSKWFHRLARRARRGNRDGERAAGELLARCHHALTHVLGTTRAGREPGMSQRQRDDQLQELLTLLIRSAELHAGKPMRVVLRFARDEFVRIHP
jgi:pimeloyl-ACP methyl ester carboxylesterase